MKYAFTFATIIGTYDYYSSEVHKDIDNVTSAAISPYRRDYYWPCLKAIYIICFKVSLISREFCFSCIFQSKCIYDARNYCERLEIKFRTLLLKYHLLYSH